MSAPTKPPVSEEPGDRRQDPITRVRAWWKERSTPGRPRQEGRLGRLLRQPWLLGLAAALWSAVIGLVLAALPMVVIWLGSADTGALEALRLGGLLWLVANGAQIAIAGVSITLLPWGLVIIPLVLLGYSGSWAARRSGVTRIPRLVWVVVPGAVLYALIAAAVTQATYEPTSRVDVLDAVVRSLVLSAVALSWGAVCGSGALRRVGIPPVVTVPLRAGFAALAVLAGAGAVAATISLVLHIDDAITMTQALSPGIGGGVGLLLLGIAYVPVVATWGAAYVIGAGLSLGPDVTMSPFLAAGAPVSLPPFPLLAALPGQAPPMAWLLPITGILAGVLAGALIGRRLRQEQRLVRVAGAGAAAFIAGAGMALLAWLSSGSLGTASLAALGPDPAVVAVLTVVLVSIGSVPAALVPSPPARPSLQVATPTDQSDVPAVHGSDEVTVDAGGIDTGIGDGEQR